MNKPLIITIAVVIFLLALGSWAYLFFFGAPQNPDELFTDLGINLATQTDSPTIREIDQGAGDLVITGSSLQQLTFRPVAGFVSDGATRIRYAEQGTGHIYEIDLSDSSEVRISNTTVPQVQDATFAADGSAVALQTYNRAARSVVGTIVDGGLTTQNLPPRAQNLHFLSTSTITYTLSNQDGTTGYRYNLDSESQTIEYVVPFASVITHHTPAQTYVSNRHAPELEGALWAVDDRSFRQVSANAFGFVTELGNAWYSLAFTENDTYQSRAVNLDTGAVAQLPVSFIPEKCDWGSNTLWCAAPFTPIAHTYLKEWYQGTVRANDVLWAINPATETAELLVNPVDEINRQLDITNLTAVTPNQLLFVNRHDNTLWLYDGSL